MQTMSNILSLAIWIPVAFGILLLVAGRQQHAGIARWVALIGSVISFLVTLPLMTDFDTTTAAMQFVEKASWIERFNVFYHLGVDGISMWFVPLTAFITSFSSPQGLFWAKLSAASTLAIAPILIMGWFSQKQLVRGLTFGAVK